MVVMVVHGGDAVWLVLEWMCMDGFHQMFWTVNKCFLLQSTDVCEQILRVVSRSNRLEELVLENAGLRTWVFSWICEHVALCHLPFWSVHDILKKFKCTQIVFPSGEKKKPEWTKKKKKHIWIFLWQQNTQQKQLEGGRLSTDTEALYHESWRGRQVPWTHVAVICFRGQQAEQRPGYYL